MASHGVSRLDQEGSRRKRERNLYKSLDLLDHNGFDIEIKSDTHVVIRFNGQVADFWPTTGQYAVRVKHPKKPKYLRGVFNLMRDLRRRNV